MGGYPGRYGAAVIVSRITPNEPYVAPVTLIVADPTLRAVSVPLAESPRTTAGSLDKEAMLSGRCCAPPQLVSCTTGRSELPSATVVSRGDTLTPNSAVHILVSREQPVAVTRSTSEANSGTARIALSGRGSKVVRVPNEDYAATNVMYDRFPRFGSPRVTESFAQKLAVIVVRKPLFVSANATPPITWPSLTPSTPS